MSPQQGGLCRPESGTRISASTRIALPSAPAAPPPHATPDLSPNGLGPRWRTRNIVAPELKATLAHAVPSVSGASARRLPDRSAGDLSSSYTQTHGTAHSLPSAGRLTKWEPPSLCFEVSGPAPLSICHEGVRKKEQHLMNQTPNHRTSPRFPVPHRSPQGRGQVCRAAGTGWHVGPAAAAGERGEASTPPQQGGAPPGGAGSTARPLPRGEGRTRLWTPPRRGKALGKPIDTLI